MISVALRFHSVISACECEYECEYECECDLRRIAVPLRDQHRRVDAKDGGVRAVDQPLQVVHLLGRRRRLPQACKL